MRIRPSHRGAFTLLEVVLAGAIFVVLAGGVYLAVSTSMAAASETANVQMESRQQGALLDYLREGFLNLPAEAEISVRGHGDGRTDLVIKHALGAFGSEITGGGSGAMLSLVGNSSGQSALALTRFSDKLSDSERDALRSSAAWLPLIENVEAIRWRFWDPKANRFAETWDRGTERPRLVELTLKRRGEGETTSLFWLPPLGDSPLQPAGPAQSS